MFQVSIVTDFDARRLYFGPPGSAGSPGNPLQIARCSRRMTVERRLVSKAILPRMAAYGPKRMSDQVGRPNQRERSFFDFAAVSSACLLFFATAPCQIAATATFSSMGHPAPARGGVSSCRTFSNMRLGRHIVPFRNWAEHEAIFHKCRNWDCAGFRLEPVSK